MRKTLVLCAALLAATAPAVSAAEFTIVVYETSRDLALRTDPGPAGKAYWEEYTRYAGQLIKTGAMRDGAALNSTAGIRKTSGKLQLSGYFKIEAADLDSAKALAEQAPSVRRGGSVEVFANMPNPTMPGK